jgi:hypothetical protein
MLRFREMPKKPKMSSNLTAPTTFIKSFRAPLPPRRRGGCNRFSGFLRAKPSETVFLELSASTTPLKRGVNETCSWQMAKNCDAPRGFQAL